jgi:hypothetical protein
VTDIFGMPAAVKSRSRIRISPVGTLNNGSEFRVFTTALPQ